MSETKWYLAAKDKDPRTNEYLVDVIGQQYSMESAREGVLCADGKVRNLWLCRDFQQAKAAIVATPQFDLKLEVLKATGDNKPELYELWRKKAKRKWRDSQSRRRVRKGVVTTKIA